MAQVQNNPKDQAMKANLPGAAVQAIVGAMETHKTLATRLLSDQGSRGAFLDVIYELLKRGGRRRDVWGTREPAPVLTKTYRDEGERNRSRPTSGYAGSSPHGQPARRYRDVRIRVCAIAAWRHSSPWPHARRLV
jgi:hypothetical protein